VRQYFARKLAIYLVTFFVAVTSDWMIPRFMPGDPVEGLLARMQAQPAAAEHLSGYYTQAFGFDVPLWQQYFNFWAALFHGDLGLSIANFPRPVTELIWGALPYTLALLVPAILLSF
jgi:peptide/nickel transport system permease protein